ncbi:MAG: hypothetical protein ABJJ69_05475 [Paracoccaceae bacterium]
MVNEASDYKSLYSRAQTGGNQEAVELLKFAYTDRTLSKQEMVLAAELIQTKLEDAPDYRRYQIGRLFRLGGNVKKAVQIFDYLSYEKGFAPAQWMFGRMIVYGEVPIFEKEDGINLLRTAQKNGHIRAPVTRLIAEFSDSSRLLKIAKALCLVPYVLRFRFYKDILKVRDFRIL